MLQLALQMKIRRNIMLTRVSTSKAPTAIGPYSQGVIVDKLLFTSGQIALDPASAEVVSGGIKEQTELFKAIKK